ncbi:hypothetical protein FQN60_012286 [Etheostoma spectabile]|uniref:Uncharacterized protein n=1 Tax=Etheostoma spectabile TaxID=54343 RepID=A0A5J5DPA1_9PERO|nr:hypothetical protein FQN60_012286 [Etheostoma spectabile]
MWCPLQSTGSEGERDQPGLRQLLDMHSHHLDGSLFPIRLQPPRQAPPPWFTSHGRSLLPALVTEPAAGTTVYAKPVPSRGNNVLPTALSTRGRITSTTYNSYALPPPGPVVSPTSRTC